MSPTRTHRWRRRLLQTASLLLLGCLLLTVIAMSLENWLLFHPFAYPAGNWRPEGLKFEDAWFQAPDGTRLHGWYVPQSKPHAAVLFCHGNAGNVTHRAAALKALHDTVGVSVLVFDYRGFGRSEGKPTGANILVDARAARRWLADREQIAESDIVVMGESVGGGVAVDLAARDGARALLIESSFDALTEVAAYHYPWLPVRWLMRTRLDSAALVGQFHGPFFQVHGDADGIVPLRYGRRLFEAANEPKHFVLLRGHDHNDAMPAEYYDKLAVFMQTVVNDRRPPIAEIDR